jgi:dihydrofolate reductase
MSATNILDKRMPSQDHSDAAVLLEAAHRPQPGLQPAMICLDPVVDATVVAAVIGRRTFDLGVGPWGGTPWPGVPSFVVTHRARQDLLGNNGGTFAFDGLQAAVRRAKQAAGHKDVLVLGANVARQLLRADLLDELRVHLVSLLLGAGTPLFDGEQAELISEGKPVNGTVTHLHYRVQR